MILALLLLIPFVGGLIAFALSKKSSEWARAFGCLVLALNLFLTLLAWRQGRFSDLEANWMLEFQAPWIPALGATFHLAMDGVSFALVLLANAISLFAVISVSEASRRREGLFFLLLLSTVTGVIGILLATDLLLFFLFWEVMLVPLYFLILVFGEEQRHKAATRFLILTQTSGLFLLLSIVTLFYFTYTATGEATFSYDALLGFRLPPNAERFVAIGFLLAFLVKLPALPFHFWMPSVFANAPISALMTGLLIKTGAYGLMRFFVPLFPFSSEAWAPYLMLLGIATLYYGAVVAYSQSDIKKILAYATISHVGLMLAGIFSQNALAMSGVSVLLITQVLSTGGLLIIANHVYSYTRSREISHFSGLYKVMPRAGIIALIFVMASVALPGLGNFVGEWLVLLGLFQRDPLLGILAAIGIVLSAAYMLRFLHLIFFGPIKEEQKAFRDLSPKSLFSCTLLLCILLWMGLYPAPLLDVVSPTWQEEGESGPVIESGIDS